jgi:hypothetical protein
MTSDALAQVVNGLPPPAPAGCASGVTNDLSAPTRLEDDGYVPGFGDVFAKPQGRSLWGADARALLDWPLIFDAEVDRPRQEKRFPKSPAFCYAKAIVSGGSQKAMSARLHRLVNFRAAHLIRWGFGR